MRLGFKFLWAAFAANALSCTALAYAESSELEVGPKELEGVFDEFFDPESHTYTGAMVAIVRGGEIVLLKGYGFQDAARTIPVSPETTVFRLASVTKTLVGTGVGQLIDAGKISRLDDPVNLYASRFQLPPNNGHEITLRMLATHQAGFAEKRGAFESGMEKSLIGAFWHLGQIGWNIH